MQHTAISPETVMNDDALDGYRCAGAGNWELWCLTEAVWWFTDKITYKDMEQEYGNEAYLAVARYRAFLAGGKEAFNHMLTILSARQLKR